MATKRKKFNTADVINATCRLLRQMGDVDTMFENLAEGFEQELSPGHIQNINELLAEMSAFLEICKARGVQVNECYLYGTWLGFDTTPLTSGFYTFAPGSFSFFDDDLMYYLRSQTPRLVTYVVTDGENNWTTTDYADTLLPGVTLGKEVGANE